MNEQTIHAAAARKDAALRKLWEETETLITCKAELDTVSVYFTNLGLEGTNEKARAADLATKTEDERSAVAEAERAVRVARLECDLAQLELDRIRYLLRLMGVSQPETAI